jgi:hypothetical protein
MASPTAESLYDALTADLSWRKKELTLSRALVETANEKKKPTFIRGGVLLLYAHWEGFVKFASVEYAKFVSVRRLTYSELASAFVALEIRKRLPAGSSRDISAYIEVCDFFRSGLQERIGEIHKQDAISTKSNLSSKVLKNIMLALNLDYRNFETRANMIDNQLLFNRHNIAHGKQLMVDVSEYEELCRSVIELLDEFVTQVTNAAYAKTYLTAV